MSRVPVTLSNLCAALFSSTLVVSLIFDALWLAKSHGLGFLPSTLFAAVALGLPFLGAAFLLRGTPSFLRRLAAALLFFPAFYVLLLLQLSQSYFFSEAIERRFSLLDVAPRDLQYIVDHVLPRAGLFLLLGLIAALHGLAYAWARFHPQGLFRFSMRALGLAALGSGLAFVIGKPPLSPLIDTARDVVELRGRELVSFDEATPLAGPVALLDRSAVVLPTESTRYDRVLVFVMETMWPGKFEREASALPASTFVNAAPANVHAYTRYYTTNQDSRTSVLGLMGSRFVPEQAYTEEGRDRYLHLEKESSLVDVFAKLGYETAFAASQGELELVVGDLPWQHTLMLEQADLAKAQKSYLCFSPYKFEHSCEDKALLPEIFALIDQPKRVLLVQQMMWGHASEYNRASGKTNTQYYSEYLDLVVSHLREKGLLERTLIVLTSDHGLREKDHQLVPDVYRVPLWFYSTSFGARAFDALYSHLDFKALLLAELTGAEARPQEQPFVLIVGTTGSSLLAVMKRDEMFVIKDRPFASYLLPGGHRAIDGKDLGRANPDELGRYLKLFHTYREGFGPPR